VTAQPAAAAAAEPRTLAPPERRLSRVVANEPLGAYRLISAHDPDGPSEPRPGQFYMLAADERWGGGADERPHLSRAFSYARARPARPGVRLDFLLEAVGPGTERLGALEPGEGLALVGPLGIGFRPPEPDVRPLLVGGGIGTAPLLCLADELGFPRVLLGFRSGAHSEAAGLFQAPIVATDDGSVGRRALVTELLAEELERNTAAIVYACGPPPMLEATRAICADRRVPAQLALESGMACGFGACFGCVVPTRGGYVRLCVDGPVLEADQLEVITG
jgi:dihydroorotate dehydrogenase electron transfer subunit